MSFMFESRLEAGKKLSNHIDNNIKVDTVVIPYPEACEIGLEVARSQDADISVRLSGFLSAPELPQPVGGVSEDGTIYLDDGLVDDYQVGSSYIKRSADLLSDALKARSIGFEEECEGVALVVSDGTGKGFREAAVAGSLLKDGFETICLATPIKARDFKVDLRNIVDELFYLDKTSFKQSSPSRSVNELKGQRKVLNKRSLVK